MSACGGLCIDLFDGGRSDEAGLYTCTPGIWNQKWVPFGKTFQEVTNGKCLVSSHFVRRCLCFVGSF